MQGLSSSGADSQVPALAELAPRVGLRALIVGRVGILLLVLFLGGLAFLPLVTLLVSSVRPEGQFGFDPGFTLISLTDVFNGFHYFGLLLQSLRLAVVVVVPGVVLGTLLAWLVARTDIPFRKFVGAAVLIPMLASPFVGTIAWANLGSKNSGYLNTLLPLPFTIDVYTFSGVAWILFLFFTPYIYLFTIGAFRRIDSSTEEAAQVFGASTFETFRKIDLPMVLPGVLSGATFVSVLCIETYTVPVLFGAPAGYVNLASQVFYHANSSPRELAHAAAAGLMVLVAAGFGLWVSRRLTRRQSDYGSVSGKGFRQGVIRLGAWRYFWFGIVVIYVLNAAVIPFLALAFRSLLPHSGAGLSELTMENYRRVFADPLVGRAIINTVVVSVSAAIVATMLGAIVSYREVRRRKGARLLSALTTMPVAIPGVIMGLAFFLFALETPWYGSIFIILLVFVTKYTPYAINVIRGGLLQLSYELEEAAMIHEHRHWRILQKIILPAIGPSMIAAGAFALLLAMKELAASIFVSTSQSVLLPVLTWNYMDAGATNEASALGIIESLLLVTVVLIGRRFIAKSIESSF